jgi:molybdopterin molybdotransferase
MVSVEEASNIISKRLFNPSVDVKTLTDSVGLVLAEPIYADRDLPPFDRVTMDGIAISYHQWEKGTRDFVIEDIQAAGTPQKKLQHAHNCIEIMTGAVLPAGTDTVIRYEDIEVENGKARIRLENLQFRQNVHHQGIDAQTNEILLSPGILISPAEVALLASVGKHHVKVFSFPSAAVVSTGDELIDIQLTPDLHQIRRSNTYALEAAMKTLQWSARQFHLADDKNLLRESLRAIVAEHDVLILSGGVSKGKFDFVPAALEEIGIKKLFHQVNQRPGKPFWFGASDGGKIVFALPGNPVSTYLCFYRYVKPWIQQSLGLKTETPYAILAEDFSFKPDLTYFLQVEVKNVQGKLMAYPKAGGGSGDFANLKEVTGFIELPAQQTQFKDGEVFPYIPFRNIS